MGLSQARRKTLKSIGVLAGMLFLFCSGFLSLAGGIYMFINLSAPTAIPYQKADLLEEARTQLQRLGAALDAFKADCRHYPTTAEGLQTLFVRPAAFERWRGPYLEGRWTNQDPWGHPYRYVAPGAHNRRGFDLASAGPDGKFDTEDDLTNW